MSLPEITFRRARITDARRIAELYSIASDGVADYIWSKKAQPGDSLLDIGQQRYERKNTEFSFENSIVAEANDAVIAVMLTYKIEDDDYEEEDPVLKPFWLLDEPDSYYVAGLAVEEGWRRRGIARHLMQMAEEKCRALKLNKLSLIVFEENKAAHDFYIRLGYREVMRKPIVPHPLIRCTGNALLMVKKLKKGDME